MKRTLLFATILGSVSLVAQTPVAEVSGVAGTAFFQAPGQPETQLRAGTRVVPGAVIRTGPAAAVDLYLGSDGGVLRLTQNTVLSVEKLEQTNAITDIYLYLQQGTALGNGSRIRPGLRYRIKVANGVAAIGDAAFRLHAEGYAVVVSGKAQFAYITPAGNPEIFSMTAPPAVYFSPTEGVKGAPRELVREVTDQSKAKLGSR
ncbi:MAG: hypothetical protein L0Y58_20980 [Verrucomicrobia subdivision 3 bacterium]|nr:hypothetical protein [Limisphaerales bacterium]